MLMFDDIWRGFHNLSLLPISEAEHLTFFGVSSIMIHGENAVLHYHLWNCVLPTFPLYINDSQELLL